MSTEPAIRVSVFGGVTRIIERALEPLLALLMFMIMAVMTLDVAGRYFVGSPIKGSYELVSMAMAATIFLGLPLCTARKEHICVDLFDDFFARPGPRFFQEVLINLLGAVTFFAMAWRLWIEGVNFARSNEATMYLKFPLAAAAYFESVLIALAALVFVARLAECLAARTGGRTP